MNPDIKKVLLTQPEIEKRIQEMGEELTKVYQGKDVVMVVLLKGAAYFACDLSRAMDVPVRLEFMVVSSYGDDTESSGHVAVRLDIKDDIAGKHVLLVDDILDSGTTMEAVKAMLETKRPASIKTAVLCDKPERRANGMTADYVGFTIPNEFVVGYGLDYASDYRNLPFIGILKPSVYGRA